MIGSKADCDFGKRIRRWSAISIVVALFLDVALRSTGTLELCSRCGSDRGHLVLIGMGLAAWSAFLAVERRCSDRTIEILVGLLAGAHCGLATYLVILPRLCWTCFLVCVLALVAVLATARIGGRPLPITAALTLSVIAVHVGADQWGQLGM